MTFLAVLSLTTTTTLIGIFSWFAFRQYRRVQKRNASRRRIQTYRSTTSSSSSSSSSSQTTFQYDPLDHSLYWYPVAFSHEVKCGPGQPFGFYLLNEPMCLYRRNDGEVVCVLDLCPHRSAPLSIGQITKEGNLECIYHGWQYGANGQCVRIPSVSKQSNTASLICARTKPVHEQYGFIWVWPGKRELANSDLIPHNLFSDVQNGQDDYILSPEYSCNLDIPYDLMVDNLLDMAHVDFTHDGTIGKRSRASGIRSERITPSHFLSTNSESATYKVTRFEVPGSPPPFEYSHFHFIPPCFNRLEHCSAKTGRRFIQIFVNLPSAENKMRLMLQFYRNFFMLKSIEYIPGYDYLFDKSNWKTVSQDLLLLDGIHRNIVQMGAKPLGTTVSADGPIKAFRRYQARALAKFETIYVKQGAWITSTTKSTTDTREELDIEDLKME